MAKLDRINFLQLATTNDSIEEWDMLLSNWDLFSVESPISFDTVLRSDIQRPDRLSQRIYGNVGYWWILCKFNQIDDVWNDLYVGMDLIVPNKIDIERFYGDVRRRINKQ